MINYEKLSTVHKLYPQGYLKIIPILNSSGECTDVNYFMDIKNVVGNYFMDIDDLITTLKMQLQPNPSHQIGDDIWFYDLDGTLRFIHITHIDFNDEQQIYFYRNATRNHLISSSHKLFKSKIEALEYELERLRGEE